MFWQVIEAIGGLGLALALLILAIAAAYQGHTNKLNQQAFTNMVRAFNSMRDAHDSMRVAFDLHAGHGDPVQEYALAYTGGNMLVQPQGFESFNERHGLSMDQWIAANSTNGGQVCTRTIRVVEGWQQVLPTVPVPWEEENEGSERP